MLKREVQRQREEKEVLEANIREQVFSEMMEVISGMEKDFSQTLETERALLEERFEDKINNLQKSLKRYYNQEIEVRGIGQSFGDELSAISVGLKWWRSHATEG